MSLRMFAEAVVHGRFQPFHLGHLEYVLAGERLADHLIVGITSPDPWQTAHEPTNPGRSLAAANPCTFFERLRMVDGALRESDVSTERFTIVPFPHSFPERLGHYLPPEATLLLTIYDEWGEEKLRRFLHAGFSTHVLWRRTERLTSGTEIRQRIAAGEAWEHLVPSSTAEIIKRYEIDRRIVTTQ
jgi:cytidyltransferase-like protein